MIALQPKGCGNKWRFPRITARESIENHFNILFAFFTERIVEPGVGHAFPTLPLEI
jgi:hypothetical protein